MGEKGGHDAASLFGRKSAVGADDTISDLITKLVSISIERKRPAENCPQTLANSPWTSSIQGHSMIHS